MKQKPTYDELLKQNEQLLNRITHLEQSLDLCRGEYNNLLGLFDNSTIGMVICTTGGRFLKVNRQFTKITGYSKDELSSMTFRDLTYHEDQDSDVQLVKELLEGKRENFQLEKRYITKDQRVVWVNLLASVVPGSQNKPEAIIGTVEDITERKKIAIELEKSKSDYKQALKLLQSIQNAIPDLIGVQDLDHNIIQYNQAGYKLLNKTPEEVVGMKCYKLIGRERVCDVCSTAKAIETQKPARHERYFPELDIWLDIRAYPIFNDNHEIIYVVEHLRDITNMKKMELQLKDTIEHLKEAKLRAEESDNLKTAFLHNISHEIRTPLNGIIGFADLLAKEDPDHETIREYIDIITRSGLQLLGIINDLVSIATIESGQEKVRLESVDIQHLLKNIHSDFHLRARNKGLALYYKPEAEDIKYITTDETKLHQVLSNLLTNAIKFTHAGYVEWGVSLDDGKLRFYVKDTGIGIQKEDREKIFERFHQSGSNSESFYEGSGLGLAISKAYLDLLGGNIWVESELDKGSTFYFELPLPADKNSLDHRESKKKKDGLKTVLIAEDDEVNFLYFAEVVKGLGLHLLHAKNGSEAVDLCERENEIDLIFMDIKMPEMDGHEATKRIKRIRPGTPIIAMSAYFENKEKDVVKQMGCRDYLAKPVRKEQILDRIESLTGSPGSSPE